MAGECLLLCTHTSFFSFSLRCGGLRARHMLPKLSLQYAVVVLTGKYFLASPPPFPTPDSTPSTAIQAINGRGGRERGGGGRLLLRPRRRRHHTILQTGLFSPPPLGGRQQHLSLSLSTFEAETVRSPPFPPPVPP